MGNLFDREGRPIQVVIAAGQVDRLLASARPLTTTGVQYNVADADAVATTVQSTETDLFTFTLNTGRAGVIDYLEFGLTAAFIQLTGAVNGLVRWYIREHGVTAWTEIHESGAQALQAAMTDYSCSGYWKPASETEYPIEVKLTLETDGAANMGKGKVKNSSYIVVYFK